MGRKKFHSVASRWPKIALTTHSNALEHVTKLSDDFDKLDKFMTSKNKNKPIALRLSEGLSGAIGTGIRDAQKKGFIFNSKNTKKHKKAFHDAIARQVTKTATKFTHERIPSDVFHALQSSVRELRSKIEQESGQAKKDSSDETDSNSDDSASASSDDESDDERSATDDKEQSEGDQEDSGDEDSTASSSIEDSGVNSAMDDATESAPASQVGDHERAETSSSLPMPEISATAASTGSIARQKHEREVHRNLETDLPPALAIRPGTERQRAPVAQAQANSASGVGSGTSLAHCLPSSSATVPNPDNSVTDTTPKGIIKEEDSPTATSSSSFLGEQWPRILGTQQLIPIQAESERNVLGRAQNSTSLPLDRLDNAALLQHVDDIRAIIAARLNSGSQRQEKKAKKRAASHMETLQPAAREPKRPRIQESAPITPDARFSLYRSITPYEEN